MSTLTLEFSLKLTMVLLGNAWMKIEDGRYWRYTHKSALGQLSFGLQLLAQDKKGGWGWGWRLEVVSGAAINMREDQQHSGVAGRAANLCCCLILRMQGRNQGDYIEEWLLTRLDGEDSGISGCLIGR